MATLFLDAGWDISLDSSGNIALASGDYAVAQNVANAVKLFTNDAYFNTEQGIPHFEISLKRNISAAVIRSRIKEAAEKVQGVKSASVRIKEIKDNALQAEILITLTTGTAAKITANIK